MTNLDRMHRQVRLRKNNVEQVTWIEVQYAKVGNIVELKYPDGSWDNGWEVISVGMQLPTDTVMETERRNRKTPPSLEKSRKK